MGDLLFTCYIATLTYCSARMGISLRNFFTLDFDAREALFWTMLVMYLLVHVYMLAIRTEELDERN